MSGYLGMMIPGCSAVSVVPGSGPLPQTARSLWIGQGGNLHVVFEDDSEAVDIYASEGVFPFRVKEIKETLNNPADLIWAIY